VGSGPLAFLHLERGLEEVAEGSRLPSSVDRGYSLAGGVADLKLHASLRLEQGLVEVVVG